MQTKDGSNQKRKKESTKERTEENIGIDSKVMATSESYNSNTVYDYATTTGVTLTSGTWTTYNGSVYLNNDAAEFYNYVPVDLEPEIQPIQGDPKGAGWLVSWWYKKKDPVCFCKSRSDMLKIVSDLMKDERVIKSSIIIHKISAQYRPKEIRRLKRLWVKELTLKRDLSKK